MVYRVPLYGYDPRGVVQAEATPLAPRRKALGGLRLAVLDNAKMKARRLLDYTTEGLAEQDGFAAVNYYLKEGFSYTATPQMLAEIAANNDVVVTAIGD